jgi:type II secretion system protein J
MTLIEVLVSLSIGSIVIAAVFGVLASAQHAREQGETRSDLFQATRVALDQIERDLRVAVYRSSDTNFDFTGVSDEMNGLPADQLSFAAASGSHGASLLPTGDLVRVSYSIADPRETSRRGFVREALSIPLPASVSLEQEELATREYCPSAVGLDIVYYDPEAQNWVEDWQQRTSLPSAVKVTLYVVPPVRDEESEPDLTDMRLFSTTVCLMLAGAPLGTGQRGGQTAQGASTAGTSLPGSISIPGLPTSGDLSGLTGPGGGGP